MWLCVFFFQAEDGIRDLVRSRGLGDVYKRQVLAALAEPTPSHVAPDFIEVFGRALDNLRTVFQAVSYTHLTLPTSDLV